MDPIIQGIASGLAVEAIKTIVAYGGRKIKKRFKPETKRESALKNALTSALAETIQSITTNQDKIPVLQTPFRNWLVQEDVAVELSAILESEAEAGDALDKALLIEQLKECWEPIGFDDRVTHAFVVETMAANLDISLSRESALQGEINIRLLKDLKGAVGEVTTVLEDTKSSIQGVGDDIIDRLPASATDLLESYLDQICIRCGTLDLSPFDTDSADALANKDRLSLTDVYIGLNLKGAKEEGRRLTVAKDRGELEEKPKTALEIFGKQSQMVLLGEPGGGKTTFTKYLSFCLASHQLGDKTIEEKLRPEGWSGEKLSLVPVPVILRDLVAWIEKYRPKEDKGALFISYLKHFLTEWNLAGFEDRLSDLIRKGRAVIFLDGLDEVVANGEIRLMVMKMVKALPDLIHSSPIMVSCRVLSYEEDSDLRLGPDWHQGELAHFTDEQVNMFLDAWFQCNDVCRLEAAPVDACCTLKKAVRQPGLEDIYRRPLMLTVMAIVHNNKGWLPGASVLLYQEIVDILLSRWDEKKSDGEGKGLPKLRDLLKEARTDFKGLLKVLSQEAFEAHKRFCSRSDADTDTRQTAEISETSLQSALKKLHPDFQSSPATGEDAKWAARVTFLMKHRAGLLIERKPGVYYFPHRIFQEYLAACHLTSGDFARSVMALQAEHQSWRVVILLAVSRFVRLVPNNWIPLQLVWSLLKTTGDLPKNDRQWRYAWLAGECVLEIGAKEIEEISMGPEAFDKVKQLMTSLCEKEHLTPRERAEAANILGKLGDDRPGVGWGADNLPDIQWVDVTGDKFIMGAEEKNDPDVFEDEAPVFTCRLLADKPYRISKYPVTVKQYRAFIDDGGYENDDYWGNIPAGLEWRNEGSIKGVKDYGEPFDIPNHPQVGVSWFEAVAFCNWLSSKTDMDISLPTEAQWERAARGTDGRKYPWGGEFDTAKCNCAETGIGATSAVGIFPSGNALENGKRIADLSGNTWEWCRTKWRKNYQNYEGEVDDALSGEGTRVLRGGAFFVNRRYVRSASRSINPPLIP